MKRASKKRLKKFAAERDEAFFSKDMDKILRFLEKQNGKAFAESFAHAPEIVQQATIYKVIYNSTRAPKTLKEEAITWLTEHNMKGNII